MNRTSESSADVVMPDQAIAALVAAPPTSLTTYVQSKIVPGDTSVSLQLKEMDYAVSIEASSGVVYTAPDSGAKTSYDTLFSESKTLFESLGFTVTQSADDGGGALFLSETTTCSLSAQHDTVATAVYACVLNSSARTTYDTIRASLSVVHQQGAVVPQEIVTASEVTAKDDETEVSRVSLIYTSDQGILEGYVYFVGGHNNEGKEYITSYKVEGNQDGKGGDIPEASLVILNDDPWKSVSGALIGENI
jgi:hypothetical protein